jgi:hypothetical protein
VLVLEDHWRTAWLIKGEGGEYDALLADPIHDVQASEAIRAEPVVMANLAFSFQAGRCIPSLNARQ